MLPASIVVLEPRTCVAARLIEPTLAKTQRSTAIKLPPGNDRTSKSTFALTLWIAAPMRTAPNAINCLFIGCPVHRSILGATWVSSVMRQSKHRLSNVVSDKCDGIRWRSCRYHRGHPSDATYVSAHASVTDDTRRPFARRYRKSLLGYKCSRGDSPRGFASRARGAISSSGRGFFDWPGCSYIRVLARRRRPRGVTPVRLPDSVRCHVLWQSAPHSP